jgi:hypothetical protein
MLLMRADGVWEAFLDAAERQLPPRDFAVAAVQYEAVGARLAALCVPWQTALGAPAPA